MKDKAYKVLASQIEVSNSKAKSLIDRGLVYAMGKKVRIARADIDVKTKFTVHEIERAKVIFEDSKILVVDKPAFLNTDEIERQFKHAKLLHRLDRETSGVLMLCKDEQFHEGAINAFKRHEVYKEYVAWVEGLLSEAIEVDAPIQTTKIKNRAHSKVVEYGGKPAHTSIEPLLVSGKKTKVKVVIKEGRTHQIRAHMQHSGFPIIGDTQYGGRQSKRVMLHAKKVEILGYSFEAEEPSLFAHFASS